MSRRARRISIIAAINARNGRSISRCSRQRYDHGRSADRACEATRSGGACGGATVITGSVANCARRIGQVKRRCPRRRARGARHRPGSARLCAAGATISTPKPLYLRSRTRARRRCAISAPMRRCWPCVSAVPSYAGEWRRRAMRARSRRLHAALVQPGRGGEHESSSSDAIATVVLPDRAATRGRRMWLFTVTRRAAPPTGSPDPLHHRGCAGVGPAAAALRRRLRLDLHLRRLADRPARRVPGSGRGQ